jgi:thiol-disulfide isomerase/thioredoxin
MDTTGSIVAAVVLVLGTVGGWWWRRADGRLEPGAVPAGDPGRPAMRASTASVPGSGTPASACAAGVGAADPGAADPGAADPGAADPGAADPGAAGSGAAGSGAAGSGAADPGGAGSGAADPGGAGSGAVDSGAAGQRIDPALLATLGVGPARATLLQFSSAFCAPCRALRRVSGEVADLLPGVRHVEVDAESHLDAVRALGIWRTPTLLVLDAEGRVAKRATGVPAKAQLIAVLGDLLRAV